MHLVVGAAQGADLEGGGRFAGVGLVVPGVLAIHRPCHKEVVAGRPEHQIVGLVVLQSLSRSTTGAQFVASLTAGENIKGPGSNKGCIGSSERSFTAQRASHF